MSIVTVSEVLTLPVLRGSYVVAGDGGLNRSVTGVNVMEVPDIESFVKAGELLLTTAYPMRDHPESLSTLVRTLHRLELAALAIKPGRYLDRLPEEMLVVANELKFPIIVVADRTSFNEVIGALLAVVLIEYGAEPAGAEAIRERLTGVALSGGGLVEIARTLSGALDRQVDVLDPAGALLGHGGDADSVTSPETWIFPITVAGSERGKIMVGGVDSPSLGQRRLIRQACFAAGMHIAQAIASLQLDRQMRVLFLEELVAGKVFDESLVRERSRLFDWDFDTPHRVILSRSVRELSDAAIATEAQHSLHKDAIGWARGREIVALVPVAAFTGDADLRGVAKIWQDALLQLGGRDVTVAVGSNAQTSVEIAASHEAARESLIVAHATHRQVVLHDSLTLERVILSVPRALQQELVDRAIGPLVAADAATGSDLCGTLEMFLGTGNAAHAARLLYIHYNTLKHRMARVEELIPVDLRDPRTRLTLTFALEVRKLLVTAP